MKRHSKNIQLTPIKAVFLPEAADYLSSGPEESQKLCKPVDKSPLVLGLQESAKKHSLPISVGVHEPSDDPNSKKLKNTLLWIDEKGEITQRYQVSSCVDDQHQCMPY